MNPHGPGIEEYGLDIEHKEEDGKQVVTHLETGHRLATGGDTALIGLSLLWIVGTRGNQPRYQQRSRYKRDACQQGHEGEGDILNLKSYHIVV